MTLANDIYTLLNTADWIIATVPKPTRWIVNQMNDTAIQMRDLIILSEEEGLFTPNCTDGSDDMKTQHFEILGAEGNEVDCGKMIAMIKKILKRSSSAINGTYQLHSYKIIRDLQVCKFSIQGNNIKVIEDDAF
jgi:hypothetical protein